MTATLEFQGTTKSFGSKVALDHLSLVMQPGEILGFIGPNGAGKTTAIHLALGFLRPTSGGGVILGKPFGNTATRARIGYLPDVSAYFSESARSAVELAGKLNGMLNPRLRERAVALLDRMNLASAGKDARKFSRGMQQRLGLAQALINEPELMILDEPTSALDPPGVLEVRELLRAARDEGKSIFFSSHQLSEVEQICDRIAFLDHGKLLRHGPLQQFLQDSGHSEIILRGLPAYAEILRRYQQYLRDPANGNLRFVVPVQLQRGLIEQAWAVGAELVSVAPVRRTLEELFVAWSNENSEAGGA
ncbi:MAG TPA: ABC transporter ATP-binding protein [Pseudacidobacterium sp.]|nr:ABC transporter ATP-binding protein [Pseudacidobacterium sp.]